MKTKIGITGEQKVQIFDPSVDPVHAFITPLEDGRYLLEDNNSAGGTFVGGLRIRRKTVKPDTAIRLGNYTTSIHTLMTPPKKLREVWDTYMDDKWKINRQATQLNNARMMLMGAGGALAALAGMFLDGMVGRIVGALVPVSFTAALTWVISRKLAKVQKESATQIIALNNQLKSEYVCPKCHQFLGYDTPYSDIKAKGCPRCGHPL